MNKARFFLTYGLIFICTFWVINSFQSKNEEKNAPLNGDVTIESIKSSYAIGKDVRFDIQNNTDEAIILTSQCPQPILKVSKYSSEGFEPVISEVERDCENSQDLTIAPGTDTRISLVDYSYSVFGELGRYKVEIEQNGTTYTSPEFEITQASLLTRAWRTLIYNPILNALIALVTLMPGHNLGLAIVILTLAIRTILLIPSVKAIRAQKRMQEVQPKIEALRKKYEHDQARLAQETMKLWKDNKVSPLSSCLPMLIQFPVLIALFYVVSSGLVPDRTFLIYDFIPGFSFTQINPEFLGLNLLQRNLILLPIIIGSLQFIQMQLMTYKRNKKKDSGKELDKKPNAANEVEKANQMMKYVMPVMIAVFTAQLPAAVGLYWGTSTFYGILQQLVVNKEGSSPTKTKSEDDVTVRVINKNHGKKD